MGQQTENGGPPREDGTSASPATPEADSPGVLANLEDAPYVPRVFAFDPSVSAELRDPEPDGAAPAPASSASTPGGRTERRSVLASIRANAAEPPKGAPEQADTEAAPPAASAWQRPDQPSAPTPVVAPPEPATVEASQPPSSAPGASATQEVPDDDSTATFPRIEEETAVFPPAVPPTVQDTAVLASAVDAADAVPTADVVPLAGSEAPAPENLASAPSSPEPPDARDPDGPSSASPLDELRGEEEHRRGWVRALAWTGVGVVVLGGLYAGAQWFFADKVARGTTVAGVEIGGMSSKAAVAKLEDDLGTRAKEPIEVTAGDAKATIDPAKAGLTFDATDTVDDLASFSLSPATLWEHIAGGGPQDPVIVVDNAKLKAQVDSIAPTLAVAPVDGTVQFVDGAPVATPAKAGVGVDPALVPKEITDAWLRTTKPIALTTKAVEPAITQAVTDSALAQAQKVISGPVTVTVGDQSAELPPDVLASAASFTAKDGKLTLGFNTDTLTQAVVDRTNNLLTNPKDAHFEFANGAPKIVGGEPGTTLDPAGLNSAVVTAATGDNRTAKVELVQTDPAESQKALEALGVKEKVSEFATPLTNEPVRTRNIEVGAARITGVLVKPGETFSLLDALGPITTANGYYDAMTIQDGMHVQGTGGGLSQLSTTVFNAAYFSGVTLTDHTPHSVWFQRYPAGREATLFEGQIDNKFTNDTPYGIVLQSWIAGGEVHVAFWSTPYYKVETSDSGHQNIVGATTVSRSGPKCSPSSPGNSGFSITNYRKVYKLDGTLVKDEKWPWTYQPDNGVTCTG